MSAGGDKPKNFSKERADGLEIPIYSNGISNEGLYGFTDNARIFEESVTVSARGTIGYVCLRMQPYLPIVRLISLVPKKEYVSSKFLFLCLQNENIQGNGTTQQQLTVPDFKETKIITPNIDIIKDFNGIMDIAYNNIVSNKEENQSLTKLRDTLLSKLISGEVRLKEFREKVEQVL
jgi:type I restriction enzyme S subunit